MRTVLLLMTCLGSSIALLAQSATTTCWTLLKNDHLALAESAIRPIQPTAFAAFSLHNEQLRSQLETAPMEYTTAARQQPLLINLPTPNGGLRTFAIVESPIMAPELAAKFPMIRTYSGKATDGSGAIVRLGFGYNNFHANVFETNGSVMSVLPIEHGKVLPTLYQSFWQKDLPISTQVQCGVLDDGQIIHDIDQAAAQQPHAVAERGSTNEPIQVKKYRMAIAAKAEYSLFHGGTVPLVLSAITESLNYIVALQERDFAVRMELIPQNDQLIFFDPLTDPYTGSEAGGWMNQNPVAINSVIGIDDYDVAHVFAVYETGSAVGIVGGRLCTQINKARGCSSAPQPTGTYFNLVAAHEMCHQLSGSHTWNRCGSETVQLSLENAVEPGSGSTIMGYPGACGTDDVQGNNDPYYHLHNIKQVAEFIKFEEGNTCGTWIDSDNNRPTVVIPRPGGFVIPISTPFALTATATDPEDTNLTYCWEQIDKGTMSVPLGSPEGLSPLFRSYNPSVSPTRTFPRIQTIIGNQTFDNKREVLPFYTRVLTFACTVRDNHPDAGGTHSDTIQFSATAFAGPFTVLSPNTAVTWESGSVKDVLWDVANTSASPVNCKKVNILLSTDGGFTYATTLATDVPNTGKVCVLVPNITTTQARIRVEAADNIFFDISNVNFKIQAATTPGYGICLQQSIQQACTPALFNTTVSTAGWGGFNENLTFSAVGLPANATATFTPNPAVPGTDVVLSVDFGTAAPEATYDVEVIATSATGIADSSSLKVSVVSNIITGFALESPLFGAAGVSQAPTLHWAGIPDADTYQVQVGTSPAFEAGSVKIDKNNIVPDSLIAGGLEKATVYYWRVRVINLCGASEWQGPFVFVTQKEVCNTFTANDLPKNISTNGTPTIESVITISAGGLISDVNVKLLKGNHDEFKQMEARIASPQGTEISLFKNKCGNASQSINAGFDDAAATIAFPCPPNNGIIIKPTNPLAAFNGQNSAGDWKLIIKDNAIGAGGAITDFQLEICSATSLNPPVIITNNVLSVINGNNAAITPAFLKTEDVDNTADQLVYTVITTPKYGRIQSVSGELLVGDQFTQTEINNEWLRYYDYNVNTGTDQFRFSVTDGNGGLAAGTFIIQPNIVGTSAPIASFDFVLAPNPATSTVQISVGTPLPSDAQVTLTDAAGRTLRSINMPAGTATQRLDLRQLPGGMYAVSIRTTQGVAVRKLMISNQ